MKNTQLFKNVDYNKIDVSLFNIKEYRKKELIFFEKQDNIYFYYLISGKITLFTNTSQGKKRIFLTLDEDNIINDFDVCFNNTPYSAVAFENCRVMSILQSDLFNLLLQDQNLLANVLFLQSHRSRRLYRQLKNSTSINLDKRIAAKLWKFAKDYGVPLESETYINLKINNTYLADAIGCSRESVSRSSQNLIEKKLLRIEDNNYYVDVDGLLAFYRQ